MDELYTPQLNIAEKRNQRRVILVILGAIFLTLTGDTACTFLIFKEIISEGWKSALPFALISLIINAIRLSNIIAKSGNDDFLKRLDKNILKLIIVYGGYIIVCHFIESSEKTLDLDIFKSLGLLCLEGIISNMIGNFIRNQNQLFKKEHYNIEPLAPISR